MKSTGRYDVSFLGEFVDKSLEREFFNYYLKHYSRFIGPGALIFGTVYMLFIVADYFAIENPSSFIVILIIRLLFFFYIFYCKKINDYFSFAYSITAYEIYAVISFMVILYEYGHIGFLAFFSVMAITLVIYITPNKLLNAQAIIVLFNLSFFILFADNIENLGSNMLLKTIAYNLIFIILGSTQAYLTNYYKRKQFADRKELLRISITDSLTGIYNRAKFNEELSKMVEHCNRYGNPLLLVVLDIDDFKKVNDTYGHIIGDHVLQKIALVTKNNIRSTDIFARWGGEEFVILFPDTDIHKAMEIAERIRICIQKGDYGRVKNVTCSSGLVSLQKNEDTESLLQRADRLLYDAKKRGKNIVSRENDNNPMMQPEFAVLHSTRP